MSYNIQRWHRARSRCAACRGWRDRSDDDRCIRRTPGVAYACCGHERPGPTPGYFYVVSRGVVRFAAGISPFLLQAAVGRYIRTGHVAPFFQVDDRTAPPTEIHAVGCRFPLAIRRTAKGAGWRTRA